MNKIISLVMSLSMLISMLAMSGVESFADFGIGAQVVAADVTMIKTGLIGQKICFTDGDFKSALALSDFKSITITEIPSSTEGTLLLSGRRVGKGRVIKRKNLGALVFIPASDSVSECSFKFTVDGYAGGAEIECILKFTDKVNYAPEAIGDSVSAASIQTQESISFYGKLNATDPEGDALEFMVVSYPKNGELAIEGNSGKYSYRPYDGFIGKDKFTFVVRDQFGNYSELETVNIKVSERMCDTVYTDLEGRSEYNGAVAMTAMGIMSGKIVGDDIYFEADKAVTRAEFISMAMKARGIRADSTLGESFFDDNNDIPKSLRPYISTAARIGLAKGDFVNGKLLFRPNEEITNYEVAKIIATLCNMAPSEEAHEYMNAEGVPVWARESVSAMYTLGIFDIDDTAPDALATRANVADYLYKMVLIFG